MRTSLKILGYKLIETCSACPEQYDVFDGAGNLAAYLRFRFGRFTCEVPYVGGEMIYEAEPYPGDRMIGWFDDVEARDFHLGEAIEAVSKYYATRREIR